MVAQMVNGCNKDAMLGVDIYRNCFFWPIVWQWWPFWESMVAISPILE